MPLRSLQHGVSLPSHKVRESPELRPGNVLDSNLIAKNKLLLLRVELNPSTVLQNLVISKIIEIEQELQ